MMSAKSIDSFYEQYVDGEIVFQNDFLGHFNLLSWGNLQKDQSRCEQLQRKPFYKIALLSGEGVYSVNNRQIPVSGNTIVFTQPMLRTGFKTEDEHFDGTFIVFSESFLKGTNRAALTELPIFRNRNIYTQSLTNPEYEEFRRIFDQVTAEFTSDYPFKEHLVRNRLSDIIHHIQKSDKDLLMVEPEQNRDIEDLFIKVLEDAFYNVNIHRVLEDKSPAYFAQLLGISVDQLNRNIKRTTGRTTLSIIHERIIEEANILLKYTVYSVKEIAWCLHFQEASHFQNFYKKHTGVTPMEYRTA
ncbi:helix-turn-helix domain-containing protein [Pedobacter hartonius]|uniref:Transcriptional regulator, AraC family n=1 Tax=Pedobacter hartonius TaxID=425514 RepID=A0A1H4CSZ6_9SPHI|nr:response regulator transcription factor [Pedobacter hartonius]SEA63439.1 transcriptional regulator, AraC family [Pedobacter hartonius]